VLKTNLPYNFELDMSCERTQDNTLSLLMERFGAIKYFQVGSEVSELGEMCVKRILCINIIFCGGWIPNSLSEVCGSCDQFWIPRPTVTNLR
jgi:hypothetical protein